MEWIIGAIVIWVIWKTLKRNGNGNGNGEEAIKRAISVAYAQSGKVIPTKIPWWEAEKFAHNRNRKILHEEGMSFVYIPMSIDNNDATVALIKDKSTNMTSFMIADITQ